MDTEKELEAQANEIMRKIAIRESELQQGNDGPPTFVVDAELDRLRIELQKIDEKLITFGMS